MKVPKKIYLVAAILLSAGAVGTVLAMQPGSQHKEVTIKQTSTISKQVVEPSPATPTDTTVGEQHAALAQSPALAQTPAPEPEQPRYGEDPNNPGVFIVFDKIWVMDQVGIATDDRVYVEKIGRGWIYKASNPLGNICQASPAIKMKAFGDDYLDNPVTQLKWCNDYVVKRYGTWQKASEYFDTNKAI